MQNTRPVRKKPAVPRRDSKIVKRTKRPSRKPLRSWTNEQRAHQAALIRARRPWIASTGPKTAAGKAVSSQNALRHGGRNAEMMRIRAFLRLQRRFLAMVRDTIRLEKASRNILHKNKNCNKVPRLENNGNDGCEDVMSPGRISAIAAAAFGMALLKAAPLAAKEWDVGACESVEQTIARMKDMGREILFMGTDVKGNDLTIYAQVPESAADPDPVDWEAYITNPASEELPQTSCSVLYGTDWKDEKGKPAELPYPDQDSVAAEQQLYRTGVVDWALVNQSRAVERLIGGECLIASDEEFGVVPARPDGALLQWTGVYETADSTLNYKLYTLPDYSWVLAAVTVYGPAMIEHPLVPSPATAELCGRSGGSDGHYLPQYGEFSPGLPL